MTEVVNMYILAVEKEREFFDEIPRKLKYKKNYRTSKEIGDSDEVFEY